MRDHRRLRAFAVADELVVAVYDATRRLPKYEQYGLTSQLRRAAVSIPANIVEGCSRETTKDYAHFLRISLGSARELSYLLNLARRLDYLGAELAERLESRAEEAAAILAGLIRSLKAQ